MLIRPLLIAVFWLASAAVAAQDAPTTPAVGNPPDEGILPDLGADAEALDALRTDPPTNPATESTAPSPPARDASDLQPPPSSTAPTAPIVPEARPAPSPSPSPSPTTPPLARTQWLPFDGEISRTAAGSMDVCATAVLPLTIVPGVGDIIGTVADWFCIIPASVAVDHTGAFHGNRSSNFWQPALALVLRKIWETAVDTPIFVGTIAVLVALAAGTAVVTVYEGIPVTVLTAGGIAVTLAVYTGLKAAREGVGDFIFLTTYNLLVPEGDEASSAQARANSVIQPGVTGIPATYGLVATVAGSRAPFAWGDLLPVVGPIWKSSARSEDMKLRTHRYINEVLQVNKGDLSKMDATADVLNAVQGWSMAAGQVGIGFGLGFVGVGILFALDDPRAPAAEALGIAGLIASGVGALGVAVSYGAEKLQPVAVPIAYAMSE